MAREVPGRPGFLFGLEDEPFASGYAALPAADHRRRRRGADPARRCRRSAPVSRPLALTATLRVRDGSGPPGRAQRDPAAPAGGAADRRAPALRRRGGRGRHRRLRGDRPRPRPRARRPRGRRAGRCRGSRPTSSGTRSTASGTTSRSPAASRVANGTVDLARRRAGAARHAGRLGPLRAGAGRRPTGATSRRASASTPAGARRAPARRRRTSSSSASTARPTPPATRRGRASSRRTPASSSSR